ncbi:MAG TPA: phosphotransferase [Microbacterium sp.]|nr:phosphotransferase [Microbacterium sp.]
MSFTRLSLRQRRLIDGWMPGARVLADLSWLLGVTTVLHVSWESREFVVKAGAEANHHIGRELDAHESGSTDVWTATGQTGRLSHADRDARLLVLSFLPGALAYGAAAALDPDVHRRAGALLRVFHRQESRPSAGTDAAASRRALAWLDSEHAIAPEIEERLRDLLEKWAPIEAPLVPTHGDWQPRNWLVDGETVRVIDFGRFAFRPAATDFVRLAAQEWREVPECEAAFLDGYGGDPRHPDHWRLMRLREAIGTAVWAHQVGDAAFEAQGHRMIAEVLAEHG